MKFFEKLFYYICHPISLAVEAYDKKKAEIKEVKEVKRTPIPVVINKPIRQVRKVTVKKDAIEISDRSIKQQEVEESIQRIMKLLDRR